MLTYNINRYIINNIIKTKVGHIQEKGGEYMDDVKMFDVIQVDFGETLGSEQSGVRPAIVFQNDSGNRYSPTIIVIPLTKEIKKLYLPTHDIIHKSEENGLKCDSMLLGEAMRQVDKVRIKYKRGALTTEKEKQSVCGVYLANATGKRNCSIA